MRASTLALTLTLAGCMGSEEEDANKAHAAAERLAEERG